MTTARTRTSSEDRLVDTKTSETLEDLQSAVHRLGRLMSSRKVSSRIAEAAGVEISQQGVTLLRALRRHGRQPIASLASLASMDLGAVSRQISALERDDLVSRASDPDDGRVTILELTRRGEKVAAAIRDVGVQHLAEALETWPEKDLRHMADLLDRFVADLLATPVPTKSRRRSA